MKWSIDEPLDNVIGALLDIGVDTDTIGALSNLSQARIQKASAERLGRQERAIFFRL